MGDFSVEKSKIWGATTTPHIVPCAKMPFFHKLFKKNILFSRLFEFFKKKSQCDKVAERGVLSPFLGVNLELCCIYC